MPEIMNFKQKRRVMKTFFLKKILYLIVILAISQSAFSEKHYVFSLLDASDGLSGNKVRNIAQLPDGRMVFTTEGQMNIYDGTSFTYLHYNSQNICRLSEYSGFNHTYIDNRGYMWFKNNHTLMIADSGKEAFLEHPDSLFTQFGITTPLKDLFVDKYSNLWVITDEDDLWVIDSDRTRSSVFMNNVSLSNDQIYDLGVLDNRLYLFYRSGTLICHDLPTGKELYRRIIPTQTLSGKYGNTSYVVQGDDVFYQLCNGNSGGVMLAFNISKKTWDVIMTTDSWFNYLSIDTDKSLWISGHDGLYNMSNNLKDKQFIPSLKLVDGKKIETETSTIFNDLQGGMWIGTLNRGLLYYHQDRFRFQNIGKAVFPIQGNATIHITGFEETDESNIIVKTDIKDYIYDSTSGNISEYHGKTNIAEQYNIPDITEKVLQIIDINKNKQAGITRNGWFIYDKQNQKTDFHPTYHHCNCIAQADNESFWIGFEDGLALIEADGSEQRFYSSDGLVNNSVRSIIRTPNKLTWISTANGISCIKKENDGNDSTRYSFVNYNQYDGVISNEFCERSVYLSSEGTLYWGGINGFNILKRHSTSTNEMPYFPLFVGLKLFGEEIENSKAYQDNTILTDPITKTKSIVLKHDQNFLTIEFSAMNYVNPTQTYYRYQLCGIDNTEREIHSTDGRGDASYTDLPPGNYIFRVRAAGNGKDWSDKYSELKISIKAPFWKTGYAYTIYLFLSVCILSASIILYIKRKKRNIIREQKEKLDDMKTTFLQNINQELEEPIKKIISPLDSVIMYMDEGRNKLQLQEIRQNTLELQTLVKQLSKGILLPIPTDENNLKLDVLMIEMRQLLEQQEKRKVQLANAKENDNKNVLLSEADEKFIRKILKYVEDNIGNTEYSVESLSRDIGMDRTGLYRKLMAVVGKTPTSFIRSVRLKHAAQLLEEGYTVAEVADSVGFSTSSYLCKCFQDEFGVRPSQYVQGLKKH